MIAPTQPPDTSKKFTIGDLIPTARLFKLSYYSRLKKDELLFPFDGSLKDARIVARAWCEKKGFRFLCVDPGLMDITKLTEEEV